MSFKFVRRNTTIHRIDYPAFIMEQRKRCAIEKDDHIAISGDEGDGKSHLICETVIQFPDANLWDNIVYTPNVKELYEKYEKLPVESVMALDEALDLIHRLDWAKVQTRMLVKDVRGKVRKEKRAVWLYGVQLFRELHPYWRQHRIRHWIELAPREWFTKPMNIAFLLEKSRVPMLSGKRDTWLMEEQEKMWLGKMRSGPMIGRAYIQALRTHPFYKGEFTFKPLSDSAKAKYLKYREEAFATYMSDAPEKLSDREVKWKDRTLRLTDKLHTEFHVPWTELSKDWQATPEFIQQSVREKVNFEKELTN